MSDTNWTSAGDAAQAVLSRLIPRPVFRFNPEISGAFVYKAMSALEENPIADDFEAARQFGIEVGTVRRARERIALFAKVEAAIKKEKAVPKRTGSIKNYSDPLLPLRKGSVMEFVYNLVLSDPKRRNVDLAREHRIAESTISTMRSRLRKEGKI
jgi:hypothetical protein